MFRRRVISALALYALLLPAVAFGQATAPKVYEAPKEVIDKIKDEGMNRSQVMNTLSYLTDVIGGRLTNSPNMKRANEWTRDTMAKWGMQNAKLESWGPWGRGWSLKSFSAEVIAPQVFPVIAFPKAWSPSTKGSVTSEIVVFDAKTDEDFGKFKGKLKGKIVLVSGTREIKADFDGYGTRITDEELAKLAAAPNPADAPRPQRGPATPEQMQAFLKRFQDQAKRMNFLLEEGAAVMIDNSFNGTGGTVFVGGAAVAQKVPETLAEAFGGSNRLSAWNKAAESKMIPQMTLASEDYNRLVRMTNFGEKVQMTVNIQGQYHDEDMMGYNTVAEIPGTDPKLKDEVVMLGGHLDSWHSSTGATDNAAGSAVAMEAARILIASGLKPRRTIRVALWSGEEQGLNGSEAYVKQHFGEMTGGGDRFERMMGTNTEKPSLVKKADYEKLSAYYNLDNGTGKIRGVYMQSNPLVAPIFRAWLAPFGDMGASTLTLSNTGGTDHLSFDAIGLPGFQFIQDEIEYSSRTHHSNQDNYDRLQADDMKQASTIMAAFVYQTAMMDEKIPRKEMK